MASAGMSLLTPAALAVYAELISDQIFAVIDIETTGGNREHDRITEIGVVLTWRGKTLNSLVTLVNPGRRIPARIQEITHINDAMVRGAPKIEDVMADLFEITGEAVFVAHNTSFDMQFLQTAAVRAGLTWPFRGTVDTLKLCRRMLPDLDSHTLGSVAKHLGCEKPNAHRAQADAEMTTDVLNHLIGVSGARTLGALTLDQR